jgi:hypothetical protein
MEPNMTRSAINWTSPAAYRAAETPSHWRSLLAWFAHRHAASRERRIQRLLAAATDTMPAYLRRDIGLPPR